MSRLLIFLTPILCYSQIYAHGISEEDKQRMLDGGYLQYVGLGATHMLSGYDHLLFLFGVIFFLTKFKDIVKFITAFTVGHCITLISATFMKISMNYYLIDAVIALTVIYKGFDNVDGFKKYLNIKSPNLTVLVFIFGLIHGFGLSTRLQQLPLGDQGLLLKIISFNVGVEFGQIIALTIMLLLLLKWRISVTFAKFSIASNVGLMVLGVLLFLMQMHGYNHESFVNDLAFSTENHSDAHAKLSDEKKSSELIISTDNDKYVNSKITPWKDVITLNLPAGKDIEYKLIILKNEVLEYSWTTNRGDLFFDFHGEPKGDQTGYFKSYKKSTESESSGSFTAPFEGTHGWYWKNKNSHDVEVNLKIKGSYKMKDKK